MWCSPASIGHRARRPPSGDHRLEWTWKLEPASSKCGLAMNVAERPVRRGDLLDGVLEQQVDVGHLDGVLEREVDLVLAAAGLALGELDREPGAARARGGSRRATSSSLVVCRML